MKVAIDTSPLQTGHKIRGTGFYLSHLVSALKKYSYSIEYVFFGQNEKIPTNVDILHFPYFEPFFLTLPFRKIKKTIVTVHDLTPLVFPSHFPSGIKGKIKWVLQRRALKKVDAIITDSLSSKQDIAKIIHYPEKKISVAYLAAGEAFKQLSEKELDKKNLCKKYHLPEKFVLYVGDITWNKNIPNLIQACIAKNIPLVLAGKSIAEKSFDKTNPWNADRIQVQKQMTQHDNIFALGFVPLDDLVRLYNGASVFVMPSFYEGFGLPILEAMACGCPVICSNKGSLAEVANDAAVFVDPNSIESIGEGILKVFQDKSIQKSLREKGLKNVKKFSWEQTAEQTVAVYKNVFNSK